MRIDLYTRFVLTIIAVCLVWLSLGGPALLPVAQAQAARDNRNETRVLIAGWLDGGGRFHELNPGMPGMSGLPVAVSGKP